jgi:hypothetical protein
MTAVVTQNAAKKINVAINVKRINGLERKLPFAMYFIFATPKYD